MNNKLIPTYSDNNLVRLIINRNEFAKVYYEATGKQLRPMFGGKNEDR